MSLNKLLYSFIFVVICTTCKAQLIDNTSTFKNSLGNKYFRFHYDNDYFTKTDEYYTQGITLEYANPKIKNWITSRVLFKPKNTDIIYGLRVDNFGYTPTTLTNNNIPYGDRPYCGDMSASTFAIAVDTIKQQVISTTLIVGLMGQGAGGKEFQTGIHKWTGNVIPLGWQYQIRNDIIVDYQINCEKKLIGYRNIFLLNGVSSLRLGTHNDKATAGFNFMVGNFNNKYLSVGTTKPIRKKIQYYLYAQLVGGLVAYDATLQGGLFNKTSPYTIPTKDINRITAQTDYGIVVSFRKLYVEYCQSYLTKEFSTGHYHRWGGIRIGVTI